MGVRQRLAFRWLRAAAVMALSAVAVIAVACGGDSEPDPTPTATQPPPAATAEATATPEPTPTATPAPAPATPTATSAAAPAGSMEDFVIDASTTGKDLIDRISEGEAACIKSGVGDQIYQVILAAPLAAASSDPASAAPLFGCLTEDNVVFLGAAVIDVQAGGRADESRQCIVALALEHPEVIYVRLGLEWTGGTAGHGAEVHAYLRDFYRCLTDAEKVDYVIRLWAGLAAANPVTGREFVATLTEDEANCMQRNIPEDRWGLFLDARMSNAGGANRARLVGACFPGEAASRPFVHLFAARLGGLTDESHECVESFIRERPLFVQVMSGGSSVAEGLSAEEFAGTASAAAGLFDCLNDEELVRFQSVLPVALSGR